MDYYCRFNVDEQVCLNNWKRRTRYMVNHKTMFSYSNDGGEHVLCSIKWNVLYTVVYATRCDRTVILQFVMEYGPKLSQSCTLLTQIHLLKIRLVMRFYSLGVWLPWYKALKGQFDFYGSTTFRLNILSLSQFVWSMVQSRPCEYVQCGF